MARQVVVIALVLFVIVGMAFAENAKDSASAPTDLDEEGVDNNIVGTSDDDAESPSALRAAPIGGPVPPGAFSEASGSEASGPSGASSAASSLHVSIVAGVAATTLVGFFYI